jgi:hypothetical protein
VRRFGLPIAVLVVTLLAAGLPAGAPALAATDARTWHPHVRAAKQYARSRAGEVAFAVRTPGRLDGWRARRRMSSASVVKTMMMVAYLNRRSVRDRPLRASDRALLAPMIRRSNDAAANRGYGIVGASGLYRLAGRVGMGTFSTMPIWGESQITAADQAKFFLHLERWVVPRHRDTALELLRTIVPSQRWGIARVRPRGWALHFKGGWTSVVQNQVGVYRRGERRIAIAVLTTNNPGYAYGRETQRGIAKRLLKGLRSGSRLP